MLVDGIGARAAGTALGFWTWAALGNAVLFIAWTALTKPGLLRHAASDRCTETRGLIGGAASYLAYGILIWAFTQAPIAPGTALRETSIVFALVIGVVFLRDRLDLAKVASTLVTIAGAALLRFART